MAEEQKRKLEIPWATLLPIVAAIAGIVAQYKPLVSTRPLAPSSKVSERVADQDVDARLWQDPLAVVQKAKAELEEAQAKAPVSTRGSHSVAALALHINQVASENGVLLMPVMLDSGPYLEQAESRLRARQAVLEALSESGFIPLDGEHIGFVAEKHWSTPLPSQSGIPAVRDEGPLFFAWEECVRDEREEDPNVTVDPKNNFDRVFVLWLPAARFSPYPLRTVAALRLGLGENFPVTVIGPANSTGLQALIQEYVAGREKKLPPGFDYGPMLDNVKFFSARATASDAWLRGYPLIEDEDHSLEDEIEEGVSANGWATDNFEFHRTILTDDVVLRALVDELGRRHVHTGAWEAGHNKWQDGDHIVILSEWDSTYGRALAETFQNEAEKAQPQERPPNRGPRIDAYRYMHGLDGRLPTSPGKDESRDDSPKNKDGSTSAPGEATEGSNQSDFLRRLAESLKQQERRWQNQDKNGIRAIGILGSDIYDKLMVLRALRPVFPNAIFFTNNYDAHFERRDDWEDVHNLVVASPFGGALQPPWQTTLAPFRDSNQTSMYAATLLALRRITNVDDVVRPPHLFEVGRNGVQELLVPTPAAPPSNVQSTTASQDSTSPAPDPTPRDGFAAWLRAPRRWLALTLTGIGLLLLGGWIALSVVDRRVIGGGSFVQRLKRAGSSTMIWLLVGVPLIVFGVALFAISDGAALEPLRFFAGISIWPSEMVRLIALLLAIHFVIKAHVGLESNEKTLVRRFRLPGLAKPPWDWRLHWQNLWRGLHRWHKEHPDWIKEDAEFTVKEAWIAYLRRNQAWPRFARVGILCVIYFIFALGVFWLFPEPVVPARGTIALAADLFVLCASVAGMIILTFYVVDAIRLNSNLIRIVTGGVTKWEPDPETSVGGERIPPLTREDLARYYDIVFVADRTEVVARLIWYPLIVLAAMIMARSDYFDNWTWPYSLLLILSLNAFWAFGAAAFLRQAAEQLRRESISKLQRLRVASYNDPTRRQMFEELIEEIRALKKGAFAPLSEQPFIRAIILPSGGLGLLAVAERVLDIF